MFARSDSYHFLGEDGARRVLSRRIPPSASVLEGLLRRGIPGFVVKVTPQGATEHHATIGKPSTPFPLAAARGGFRLATRDGGSSRGNMMRRIVNG